MARMNAATAAPLTAEPLWARARAMFARAVAAIGRPAAIAAIATLGERLRRAIIAWLCPLEHAVRKLLLAETAALKRSPSWKTSFEVRNGAANKSACAAGAAHAEPDISRPETWSASFSLSPPRDPLAVPDCRAPRIRALWGGENAAPALVMLKASAHARHATAFQLARRLEALRRVLEDPLPQAQRLARLLARAVRRFPEIARRYLLAPARTGDYDTEDPRLSLDAMGAALAAPDVFADSS